MKKRYGQIIIMAIVALISTACSHGSDVLESGGVSVPAPQPTTQTAITFSGQQGEEQVVNSGAGARAYEPNEVNRANRAGATRAGTPLSDAGVTRFTVWGYKNMSYDDVTGAYDADGTTLQTVFPGYNVNWSASGAGTTTSNSNGWEYVAQQLPEGDEQTIKYWDWAARAYRYFAVTGTPTHVPNAPNGPHEFTFAADCSTAEALEATPYFTRLWFSTGNAGVYPTKQFGKPVQLEFLKPFARVRFLFNYSYAAEGVRVGSKCFKPTTDYTDVEGNKVKIARKGNVTVSYPLIGAKTREEYSVTNIDADTRLEAFTQEYIPEGTEKWYTVLPRTSQGSYTLTVNLNGADKTCTVPAEYMTWLPGYSYTYIFKITELGGVEIEDMQAAITNWSEMEGDHSVYNW